MAQHGPPIGTASAGPKLNGSHPTASLRAPMEQPTVYRRERCVGEKSTCEGLMTRVQDPCTHKQILSILLIIVIFSCVIFSWLKIKVDPLPLLKTGRRLLVHGRVHAPLRPALHVGWMLSLVEAPQLQKQEPDITFLPTTTS